MTEGYKSIPLGLLKIFEGREVYISLNRGQSKLDHCHRVQDEYFLAELYPDKCVKDPVNNDRVITIALRLIDFYQEIPPELQKQDGAYLLQVKDLGRIVEKEHFSKFMDRRLNRLVIG